MKSFFTRTRALAAAATLAVAAGAVLGGAAASRPAGRGACWPIFRGDEALTGLAEGDLPEKPALLWKFRTAGSVKSSPVIAGGKVFVGSDDGHVYAIDLRRGKKLWAYKTQEAVEAPPCVAEGSLYVGSADGNLYCLDFDGKLKWKYETGEQILGSANVLRAEGRPTRIIVGSYDNKLHCVDARTGRRVWVYETDNWINGSPAVLGRRIVFGGCDAVVHVLSADGARLDAVNAGAYIAASAALAGDEAYVGQYGGKLLRVNIRTGRIDWGYGDGESAFFSSPAVSADRVVAGCRDGKVHCVGRKAGRGLWTFKTGGAVDSSPVICGSKVVVGSDDGRLYVLSLADGSKLWSYDVGEAVSTSPAVAGGMIVVGCHDGTVYAFGPPGGPQPHADGKQAPK